jgi:DNA repair protein RecO (recombination protein O)
VTAIVDRAIVLRTWEFSETSQTVALFTLEHGALRGLAKGARREKSAFGGGFEAITSGDVVFRVRATSELALLTEWNVTDIFWGPRTGLRAHRSALYAAELLGAFITDRDAHPGLFHEAVRFLRDIDTPSAIPAALVRLQWAMLDETGHRPRIDAATLTPGSPPVVGFDPEAGTLVADPGAATGSGSSAPWRIRRETIEVVRSLEMGDPIESSPQVALDRAGRFLAACCRHHLGWEPQTASLVFGKGTESRWGARGRGGRD